MSSRNSNPVNWGEEIANTFKLCGKVILRVLGYIFNVLATCMLIGLITGTVVGGAFLLYVFNRVDSSVDNIDFLKVSENTTTKIVYVDEEDTDELVEAVDQRLYGSENHMWAPYSDFPEDLKDAITSVEDKRFWEHKGVDWITTGKATINYLLGSGSAGGSTITQQLIKNVTGDDDVSIQRKAQEIMRALQLEKTMTKEQILELYLNTIYLGEGCYGVSSAAYTYFGKEVKDLSLLECAALIGITQNPTKWDPFLHPENNQYRRQVVLTCMHDNKKITDEEYYSTWGLDLDLYYPEEETEDPSSSDPVPVESGINSWYTDAAIEETISLLMEKFGYTYEIAAQKIYTGGLQIVTAQDPKLQALVEDYYKDASHFQKADNSLIQPESSFVLIDPTNGCVKAIAGARGEKRGNRILNYATQTSRPSGSSIKPLSAYGPSLEYGLITYGSSVDDAPINFGEKVTTESGYSYYTKPAGYPQNSGGNYYRGIVPVHFALRNSINTAAYRLVMNLGLDRSFDFVTNKCHISTLVGEYDKNGVTDKAYAPLALGQQSYGVKNLELTAAYSIFANDGVYNKPRFVLKILDGNGDVLIDNSPKSEIVLSETTASIMTKMMQEVVTDGTGHGFITLQNIVDTAGKTGTTQNACDKWFVGYTPYYIAGVWFGYAMPQALDNFGENCAMSIWDGLMNEIHRPIIEAAIAAGEEPKHFELADGVITATYCRDSGKLVTDACLADPRGSRVEIGYFTSENVPTEECDCHVLVDYDGVHGGVATNTCPEDNIIQVGMIQVKRSFPVQVLIEDAQYVYYPLPSAIEPGGSASDPFFINMLPEETYVGHTYTGDSMIQFNRACQEHPFAEETEPPETDLETGPDTDAETGPDDPAETEPPETKQKDDKEKKPPETEPPVTKAAETLPDEYLRS